MSYYINSLLGKDTNNGLTPATAFATFAKVPPNSTVLLQSNYLQGIKLSNVKNLTIKPVDTAVPAQTPFILLSSCTNVSISNISVSASYVSVAAAGKGIILNYCSGCVIDSCELFSQRDTTGWTKADWLSNAAGMVIMGGNGNTIKGCKVMNCGGIQIKGHNNLVDSNFISDFPTDGMGLWASGNTISNNIVQNSHKVNANHNDLLQCGTGGYSVSANNVIIGNTFRAYTDPNQPFIARDVQGLGGFDGWYDNYTVKNNTVYVDHPIGVWFQGIKNSVIDGNVVKICGTSLYKSKPPCIHIDVKKSGDASQNITVINNTAPRYDFLSGVVAASNNYNTKTQTYAPKIPL
jgi:hypothetical protein